MQNEKKSSTPKVVKSKSKTTAKGTQKEKRKVLVGDTVIKSKSKTSPSGKVKGTMSVRGKGKMKGKTYKY